MSPRAFSRFMIEVELGGNPKIARFTDAEFGCLIKGVWALAAKSSIRGRLLVHDQIASDQDVAHQARCSLRVAARTLAKMWDLGMIEDDPEYGCARVHDWEEINPAPKTDSTAAERQARRRAKLAVERDADRDVTPASRRDSHAKRHGVTPPEVEGEVEALHLLSSTSEPERATPNVEPINQGLVSR